MRFLLFHGIVYTHYIGIPHIDIPSIDILTRRYAIEIICVPIVRQYH